MADPPSRPALAMPPDSAPAPAEPQRTQPAQPLSEPILASLLLEARLHAASSGERVRVGGGADGGLDVDEYVLRGGVERGAVVGVSGVGEVGRLISLHLLTTFLLDHPASHATIIDTTGSFPVSLLASVFNYRLAASTSAAGGRREVSDENVLELLGRVAISRVFDLDGVCEVVSEVAAEWRAWEHQNSQGHEIINDQVAVQRPHEGAKTTGKERNVVDEAVVEIGDSEEEDDDDDFTEEIERSSRIQEPQKIPAEMIIVDNMTAPISGLFSEREKGAAHNLLAALSRILNSLSEQRNLLTILLNDITTPSTSHNQDQKENRPTNNYYPSAAAQTKPSRNPTSIFASCKSQPALGRLFSDLVMLHLFISSVPKRQRDAEILYANSGDKEDDNSRDGNTAETTPRTTTRKRQSENAPEKGVEYAYVLEVLKDETPDLESWALVAEPEPETDMESAAAAAAAGGTTPRKLKRKDGGRARSRVQRWGAFAITADVGLQDALPELSPNPAAKSAVKNPSSARYADGSAVHVLKQFPIGKRG